MKKNPQNFNKYNYLQNKKEMCVGSVFIKCVLVCEPQRPVFMCKNTSFSCILIAYNTLFKLKDYWNLLMLTMQTFDS